MIRISHYPIIGLLFFTLQNNIPGFCQDDFAEQYKREIRDYKAAWDKPQLAMVISYDLYALETGKKIDHKVAYFDKSEDGYHYQMDNIAIVQDKKWLIYVDQTEKFMAVNESKGNASYPILDFDVAVLGTADIKRIDEGTQLHYIITFKGPAAKVYTKAEFFANKKNSLIQKVIFCYAYKTAYMGENGQEAEDLMKMEITYSDVRFSTNKTFNTDKFLQLQNEGKFILRGEYQNYELIDQRLNK